jgi:hypothetical protein
MELAMLVVIVVSLGALRLVAASRLARGQPRFVWLMFGPQVLFAAILVWIGLATVRSAPLAGIAVVALGVVTAWLLVRMIRQAGSTAAQPGSGGVRGPTFDYLIWAAIGAPFLLIAILAILAILALNNGFGAMY